ncbi:unnamed protein product, partial [Rotaria magnacalcarata]
NELSAAMFMHQQNWARQQMFPMQQQQQQQQPQQIEQVEYLSLGLKL